MRRKHVTSLAFLPSTPALSLTATLAVAVPSTAADNAPSIVAEDLAKLPDSNLPDGNLLESIQRIPGVAIARDQGEGDGGFCRPTSRTGGLCDDVDLRAGHGQDDCGTRFTNYTLNLA